MSIVATEIVRDQTEPNGRRSVWYRCQDHLSEWHAYGPVITRDEAFDAEAHKVKVADKVAFLLAEQEFAEVAE